MKKFKPSIHFSFLILLFLIINNAYGQVAPVNPPSNGFYINGKLKADSADVGDWVDGTGSGGFVLQPTVGVWGAVNTATTKFIRDDYDAATDKIFSGSSFGDNPNSWKWTSSKATAKCDINTALFHSTTSATQKWLILGGDRFAQTGTSYIDFQFSQGNFTRNGDGTFSSLSATNGSLAATNGRTVNDFVLSMEYTNGGAIATVHYYRWQESPVGSGTYKFVEETIPAGAFGKSNTAATDVPFQAFGSSTYAPFAFVEAAVNIDAIISGACQSLTIKSIFVSTKASDSYNAALKDFVDPQPVNFVFGQAGLTYPASSFCRAGTTSPTTPESPSGTFTASDGGVSINSATGVIDLANSTVGGPYTITYTPSGGVCLTESTFDITINPVPAIGNKTSTICSGNSFTVTPSNGVGGDVVPAGTSYTWTTPVSSPVGAITGGSAQATGVSSISQTLTNTTNAAATLTYTVTPTAGSCPGSTFTVTVTVNPKATIGNKTATICSGASFSVTPANGEGGDVVPSGTTYTWPTPVSSPVGAVTGGSAQASGVSSIGQTLTNTTNAAATLTYTVTPTSGSCTGATFTVTVTVNPKATIGNKTPAICSGASFSATPANGVGGDIVPAGTTYTWPAPVSSPLGAVTGGSAQASGVSSIGQTLTNTTNAAATLTYTVTPTSGTCAGATFTVTVTVNPQASIGNKTATICSGTAFTVTPTDGVGGDKVPAGTTYTWPAPVSNPVGAITGGSAQATGVSPISQTLTNTTNAVATLTYTVTPTAGSCPGSTFTVTVTVNPALSVSATYNPPDCDQTTFSVTVNSPSAGATYTIRDRNGAVITGVRVNESISTDAYVAPSSASFDFTDIPAGKGFQITASIAGSCPSPTSTCGQPDPPPGPGLRTNSVTQTETTARSLGSATLEISSSVTVKAMPNPFSDKVRFMITSPEAGSGTLDIYNMTGQKIKTVYQGHIPAGISYFDLTLATKARANFVYVLKIGEKRFTGNLTQLSAN